MALNENATVNKQPLPPIDKTVSDNKEQYALSYDVIESKLIDILSKLLPKRSSKLGIHDNFFECGGDSIMAIELVTQAKAIGLKISIRQVIQYPTVANLAKYAYSESTQNSAEHSLTSAISTTLPLLPNQSGYIFTKSMTIAVYLLRPAFVLDKERLEAALQLLIQRHEALRISFIGNDLQWEQLVNSYTLAPIVEYVHLENTLTDEKHKQVIENYYQKLMLTIDVENNQVALRAALFEWGQEQLFFLALDHYSFDDISMKLFWNELYLAYLGKSLPVIEVPYSAVVDNLYRLAKEWNYKEDKDFWLKQIAQVTHIPKTVHNSCAENEGIKAKIIELQSKDWLSNLILTIPASTGIQVHDVLLTTWVQTLSLWGGLPGVVLILGSHNRELLDEMVHTMGCFVTAYSLYLEAPSEENAKQAIDSIKNQLKQVPHKGMRYMLSMMVNPKWKEVVFNSSQPSLGFNYLGEEELKQEMWCGSDEDEIKGKLVSIKKGELLSGRHQATGSIPYLILHCQVNTPNRSITLTCEYDSSYYDELVIEQQLTLYQERIEQFACQLNS